GGRDWPGHGERLWGTLGGWERLLRQPPGGDCQGDRPRQEQTTGRLNHDELLAGLPGKSAAESLDLTGNLRSGPRVNWFGFRVCNQQVARGWLRRMVGPLPGRWHRWRSQLSRAWRYRVGDRGWAVRGARRWRHRVRVRAGPGVQRLEVGQFRQLLGLAQLVE